MTNPNKSVWFSNGNRDYIQKQADKESKTFNRKINEIIEDYKEKKEKEV